MTLEIHLATAEQVQLANTAQAIGIDIATYVERLLKANLTRQPLAELLKPVHAAFEASGMTEAQLSDLLLKAKKEMRSARPRP